MAAVPWRLFRGGGTAAAVLWLLYVSALWWSSGTLLPTQRVHDVERNQFKHKDAIILPPTVGEPHDSAFLLSLLVPTSGPQKTVIFACQGCLAGVTLHVWASDLGFTRPTQASPGQLILMEISPGKPMLTNLGTVCGECGPAWDECEPVWDDCGSV